MINRQSKYHLGWILQVSLCALLAVVFAQPAAADPEIVVTKERGKRNKKVEYSLSGGDASQTAGVFLRISGGEGEVRKVRLSRRLRKRGVSMVYNISESGDAEVAIANLNVPIEALGEGELVIVKTRRGEPAIVDSNFGSLDGNPLNR